MTSLLVKMLKEKFPETGKDSFSRLEIYGADERIYLSLYNKIFLEKNCPLISLKEIEDIAGKIFTDVNFEFKEQGDLKYIISFESTNENNRVYDGHYIKVHEPFYIPMFTISTGNRVSSFLHKTQRINYFNFVKEINERFINNASKF